jgi:hypothetical protein
VHEKAQSQFVATSDVHVSNLQKVGECGIARPPCQIDNELPLRAALVYDDHSVDSPFADEDF